MRNGIRLKSRRRRDEDPFLLAKVVGEQASKITKMLAMLLTMTMKSQKIRDLVNIVDFCRKIETQYGVVHSGAKTMFNALKNKV